MLPCLQNQLIVSKYKNSDMGYVLYTKLFDSCVLSVLLYGADIWGYSAFPEIKQTQQRAIVVFFGVHCFAPIAGIEGGDIWGG